jgi:hypothetical protein
MLTTRADSRCPLCRAALWAPDTEAIGSKNCPRCGAALWVLVGSGRPAFYLHHPGESKTSFLAALAGPLYGLPAEVMEEALKRADSLDLVEMVMEIEEKLRSNLS